MTCTEFKELLHPLKVGNWTATEKEDHIIHFVCCKACQVVLSELCPPKSAIGPNTPYDFVNRLNGVKDPRPKVDDDRPNVDIEGEPIADDPIQVTSTDV